MTVGTFRYVGRRRELDLLMAAVRHPLAVVLIEGEAGIGKSRLVGEAAAALRAEGGRPVLIGFCQPLREPFPYGPVSDALTKAGPWLPENGLPDAVGALARLLPGLADRLPSAPAAQGGEQAERLRLVHGVRALLTVLGPATLIIEDMHWVDEATRDLLLLLARDPPDELSLVLTYRAEDLPPDTSVLGAAYRHPSGAGGAVIRLRPLTPEDVRELASAALGPVATPALASALYERSEGLPLVAEEDLLTLAEQGGTTDQREVVRRLHGTDVPKGLREAVTERLAGLWRTRPGHRRGVRTALLRPHEDRRHPCDRRAVATGLKASPRRRRSPRAGSAVHARRRAPLVNYASMRPAGRWPVAVCGNRSPRPLGTSEDSQEK
ncbi:AAA family ATPase [Streptomyces narbonensis]|uniref:AAA family ATPase n=1 Tax=Streptomyces narbonensis TaxID=67333 RepID=UPI0033FF80BD